MTLVILTVLAALLVVCAVAPIWLEHRAKRRGRGWRG